MITLSNASFICVIGYIIICIYIGAFLGAFIFQWDNLHSEQREPCCG